MKIKDVISEAGFFAGLGKSLIPKSLQQLKPRSTDVQKDPSKMSDLELANTLYKQYGEVPGKEGLGAAGWLTDQQLQQRVLAAKQKGLQSKKAAQKSYPQIIEPTKTSTKPTSSTTLGTLATAENIPPGQRIMVQNPQMTAKFYKYPDGTWTDEFGTRMPKSSHEALDRFADASGRMEPTPSLSQSAFKSKRGRKRA